MRTLLKIFILFILSLIQIEVGLCRTATLTDQLECLADAFDFESRLEHQKDPNETISFPQRKETLKSFRFKKGDTIKVGKEIYEITGTLGAGGQAEVYSVVQRSNPDKAPSFPLAIKIFQIFRPVEEEFYASEAKHLEALSSEDSLLPRFVAAGDIGNGSDGNKAIVMEKISGKSLANYVGQKTDTGKLNELQFAKVHLQVARAVKDIHDHGLVHRDIKKENINIVETKIKGKKRVKLFDLGLAVPIGTEVKDDKLTGTPFYMSPETWAGKPASVQADLWALGVCLYVSLTGKFPFGKNGDSIISVAFQVKHYPESSDLEHPVPELPVQSAGDPPSKLNALFKKFFAKKSRIAFNRSMK